MRDELMPLLEAVREKHPSMGLRVRIYERKDNIFSRIDSISLKWHPKDDLDVNSSRNGERRMRSAKFVPACTR